jgi:hypothetical protein
MPVALFSGNGVYRDRDRCLLKQRAIQNPSLKARKRAVATIMKVVGTTPGTSRGEEIFLRFFTVFFQCHNLFKQPAPPLPRQHNRLSVTVTVAPLHILRYSSRSLQSEENGYRYVCSKLLLIYSV